MRKRVRGLGGAGGKGGDRGESECLSKGNHVHRQIKSFVNTW